MTFYSAYSVVFYLTPFQNYLTLSYMLKEKPTELQILSN